MKELSIEEKAKAYDVALEKAKALYAVAEPMSGCNVILEALFLELKESEDEIIRKRIIDALHGDVLEMSEIKEAVAWLEKQGNKKSIDELTPQEAMDIAVAKCFEQDDQKPDENSGKVSEYTTEEKDMDEYKISFECGKQQVLKYPEDFGLCMNSAWSEEDVAMIKTLVAIFEVNYSNGFYKVNPIGTTNMQGIHSSEIIKWLKSLKDKVLPQPKQEWSKEDERIRIETIELLETANHPNKMHSNGKPLDFTENINWLKSLRPQNRWISIDKEVYVKEPILAQKKDKSDTFGGFVVCCDHTLTPNVYERYMILGNIVSQNTWKPSDEQMEALKSSTYCQNEQMSKVLFGLYQDLKKLREE